MGGVALPPWKLFGLRDPALSMGSMVELMVTSKRAFIKEHLPRLLLPVSQSLWWAQLTHTLTGNPSLWFCLLWGHCSFSLGLGVHKIFICALQDWSLCFPQSCGSPIVKSYWPARSSSLGIPSPFVGSPGREVWYRVQNLHNSERTSLVLLFSSLQVTYQQVWNLILLWLHPSYHISLWFLLCL